MANKAKDPNDMSTAELEAAMAEAAKPKEPEPAAEPAAGEEPEVPAAAEPEKKEEKKEFVHTAADGTVYKAESPEALLAKVTAALDNTKTALKDREYKIHDLKEKLPPPAPEPEKYSQDKWLELVQTDAIAAQDYLDKFRFNGVNPREVLPKVVRTVEESDAANERRAAVTGFFQVVPDYAKIETPETNALLKARLEERGRKLTADTLALSYYELKAEGKIAVPALTTQAQPRKANPASPAGGSAVTVSEQPKDPNDMKTEELRAYIEKVQKEQALASR